MYVSKHQKAKKRGSFQVQDNKKPEKEWTMFNFFLGLIFLNKHSSSSPIIRGLGPIPELKRPVKPQEK